MPANERWGARVVHRYCSRPGVQTNGRVYVRAISADWDLRSDEVTRPIQRAWACFGRYKMEIYDRPSVRLRLKVRMLKAEFLETLLYGCVTWSTSKADYGRLRKAHHQMLVRCRGWRKRKRQDHILSYANALLRTESESVGTTVRRRRILFAGFVARMGEAPAEEGYV